MIIIKDYGEPFVGDLDITVETEGDNFDLVIDAFHHHHQFNHHLNHHHINLFHKRHQ